MNLNRLFFTVCVGYATTTIFGQSIPFQTDSIPMLDLEEVVVTATRSNRQLSSLPLPMTLVSAEKIRESGTVRLNEILNEQTGITTVVDESGFEGLQIQGIASDYILILIDGVPLVGRSAGNFDLSRLTVGNIEQVEVVKGPSSSLYGSEALGGVVNIITKKPTAEKFTGNASYRYGSNTQQDLNLQFQQRIDRLRYVFFANRFSSGGYDLDSDTEGLTVNPFSNYTFNNRIYYDLNKHVSLFSSLRFYSQEQDAGGIVNDKSYVGDSKEQEWNAHLRLDQHWNEKLSVQYELYFTDYNARELVSDPVDNEVLNDSEYDQVLLRPEIRGAYDFDDNGKITAGVGYQLDQLDRTFFDGQVAFNSQYFYAQYDFDPIRKLNTIVGVRFDIHSEYASQFSPKLAARYKLNEAFNLKGSVGYGFKAPDFRQLYFDFTNSTVGYTVFGYNVAGQKLQDLEAQGQISSIVVSSSDMETPLEAESSIGYNLGIGYKKGLWGAELNLFRNDFKNLIDTRIIARKTNGQNVFSYVNFEEILTTGGELNASYKLNESIHLSAGYQLLYTQDKTQWQQVKAGGIFARDPATNQTVAITRSDYFGLVNRSRHHANFKVFYDIPAIGANANFRLMYRSKYALYDTNGNGLIDPYDSSYVNGFLMANLSATKTFFKDFDLQIGANNLFDHTDPNIPTQPGRQLYLTLNYKF